MCLACLRSQSQSPTSPIEDFQMESDVETVESGRQSELNGLFRQWKVASYVPVFRLGSPNAWHVS